MAKLLCSERGSYVAIRLAQRGSADIFAPSQSDMATVHGFAPRVGFDAETVHSEADAMSDSKCSMLKVP